MEIIGAIAVLIVGFVIFSAFRGVKPETKTDDQLRFLHERSLHSGNFGASDREKIREEMKKRGLLDDSESESRDVPNKSHTTQVQATKLRKLAREAYDEGCEMAETNWPGDESKIHQHALTTVLLRRLQAEPDAPAVSQELVESLNFETIPFAKLPPAEAKDAVSEYIVWREYPALANEQLIQKVIDTLKAQGFVEDVLKGASKESLSWLAWSKLL